MNRRLETIAEMVFEGMVMADIGTDHAFLPIQLVKSGVSPKAYACDVTEGPLKIAQANIRAEGLEDRITPILCDGFADVPADTECAVIAGMGYYTASGILERAGERLKDLKQLIVEVNDNTELMRRWVSDRNYTIRAERIVKDRRHYYIILDISFEDHPAYTELEIECGPHLMRSHDPVYAEYVQRMIDKMEYILSKRSREDDTAAAVRKKLAFWIKAKG